MRGKLPRKRRPPKKATTKRHVQNVAAEHRPPGAGLTPVKTSYPGLRASEVAVAVPKKAGTDRAVARDLRAKGHNVRTISTHTASIMAVGPRKQGRFRGNAADPTPNRRRGGRRRHR